MKSMKKNLQVLSISILLISILVAKIGKADVIYTNVNPDFTLMAPPNSIATYDIDFDGNGTIELYFEHVGQFDPNHVDLYTPVGGDGSVLAENDNEVIRYEVNTEIGPQSSPWVNNSGPFWSMANKLEYQFAGEDEGFIGCRFKINGQWHYGWILAEVPADRSYIIIKSFAYNTVANESIQAGEGIPAASYHTITFDVKDHNGNPINEALIDFNNEQIQTNENGIAIFENVANTELDYSVSADNAETYTSTLNIVEDATIEVTLIISFNLTFCVTNSYGIPLQDAQVTINETTQNTNTQGITGFTSVPAGIIDYTVGFDTQTPITETITIVNDQIINVEILCVSIPNTLDEQITIFPIPCKNYVNIQVPEEGIAQLINCNGTIITQFEIKKGIQKFDLNHLSSGMYSLCFFINNQKFYRTIIK
ncbi:MAG: hypothetical protein JEZ03_17670 [Bacteroidales bacterium]|nr:hypothetical protein [Bacteroidales bacterium]